MINRNELLKSLRDWLNWFGRESQNLQIRSSAIRLRKELCLALTGLRRSGKTFTALQIAREASLLKETFYYNFEDPVCLTGATARDIETLILLFEEERGYPLDQRKALFREGQSIQVYAAGNPRGNEAA